MTEWTVQTDRFVEFNEYPVLKGAGSIAHSHVELLVTERYTGWDTERRRVEWQRAAADEISDLDALLKIKRPQRHDSPPR